jgi:hypothetical protein
MRSWNASSEHCAGNVSTTSSSPDNAISPQCYASTPGITTSTVLTDRCISTRPQAPLPRSPEHPRTAATKPAQRPHTRVGAGRMMRQGSWHHGHVGGLQLTDHAGLAGDGDVEVGLRKGADQRR